LKKLIFTLAIASLVVVNDLRAQESNIVTILDELRAEWDETAESLRNYEGLEQYCRDRTFRINTTDLLDKIHHYDTTLYQIVQSKYNVNKDSEAKATLEDIESLESDYRTRSFQGFLRRECAQYNAAEQNKAFGDYKDEKVRIEEDLAKYIDAITELVDVIDEHAHHLKDL
jgi:hypothetical protein